MPVSHLALSVSHLASSTSFFLAALQPLGYHFIGQQGDSIGLGVDEADFFLSQAKDGTRVSPTHIAFAADNTIRVRDCYAAALNAGGRPSGAPDYRQTGCGCFNAAVEDLDGNTVEFIWREPLTPVPKTEVKAPSEYSNARSSQKSSTRGGVQEDLQSVASRASRAQSRAQTALDLASNASKSIRKSDMSAPGISRSKTEPVASSETSGGKAVVGTLLGAAFTAALMYSTIKSERGSARDEEAFASTSRYKESRSRTAPEQSTVHGRTLHDAVESVKSSRPPPRSVPAIEAASTHRDPEIEEVLSRASRPAPQRSRTYDAIEYAPKASTSSRSDRLSVKRSSTMPNEIPNYYIEPPKSSTSSRHRRRSSLDDGSLKRHDSGVSMRSRRSSFSKASTAKPSRRRSSFDAAAEIPLPSSRATSHITSGQTHRSSKAPSYVSAAQMPLPQSRATSYISAAQVPVPRSHIRGGYTDYSEESDGLGDMPVVTPDDSISCVDFSSSKKSKSGSSKTSRHSSKRSEADSERTIRPAKHSESRHSAMTLPTRLKDDTYGSMTGRRSNATYT